MVKAQRITSILFIVLGSYVTYYSMAQLDIGTISKPGSGFFTLVCGLGIFILSVLWLVLDWKKQNGKDLLFEKGAWKTPLLAVGATMLYAILMDKLGYIISTAVFIIVWSILLSKSSRITIIVFTIVGTAVMYILFGPLLSVPLPRGLFGF